MSQSQGNYETQQFYYDHPKCTFSLPYVKNVSSSSYPFVYYSNDPTSSGQYRMFKNAYPSFPYIPCYFPTTSPD